MPNHPADVHPARATQPAPVRDVPSRRPIKWLALGLRDLIVCPLPGILHGLAVTAFAGVLLAFAHNRFWLLAGAFSGFLLVAPIVATGLYAISRKLEGAQGSHPDAGLADVWAVWRGGQRSLVAFGLLLALAGTGWVVTSASLITLFSPQPIRTPADFINDVVAAPDGWLFEVWVALGAFLAAPIFASSVVSIPLLLDRRITVYAAVLTSWRAVATNPVISAVWALLLAGLTLLGFGTLLIGLIVIVPMLGHASWHAYRDLVDADALPPRLGVSAGSRSFR
ncbi:DUF2189 domain-containing protein [Piscinibacterium candidicorallinum]|uniref:DUF2189 domain-containing protein n=1 Tax=Piscinibacterium candidicorallinum TaxID=1793872 RepID=A0ABV7GYX2_9BURK